MLQQSLERWLGRMAKRTIRRERPTVIGITGSVGKSSTKEAIRAVLASVVPASALCVTRKNYNNELGVPLTLFGLSSPGRSPLAWARLLWTAWLHGMGLRRTGYRVLVLEMGADKPGDLAYLTSIAPPSVSVVTAVTPEDPSMAPVHAEQYPSVDAVAQEKSTLVRVLGEEGIAILNADDMRVFGMRHLTRAKTLTFGETDASHVRILSTSVRMADDAHGRVPTGVEALFEVRGMRMTVYLPGVFGRSAAYALAAALAVRVALGYAVDPREDIGALLTPMAGRVRILPGIKHTTLFDDSYNSSPVAVLSALRDLAALDLLPGQRRAACLGEMRELGPQTEMLHRRVGEEAAKRGIDLLVCCGTFAHAMADGARAAGMTEDRLRIIEDTPEAGLFLQEWIKPGDVILAKASQGTKSTKGVRMERVIKELMAEPLRAKELLCRQEARWNEV